ncbi:hypothetical protein NUU61_006140 [Penicillium alfredii]|uniref:Uncharacterized protein n=1 Tax=Penicillium alfredii TaxID=1506179 RepID=A0A9W9F0K7_9EURO|nr:uncharacterized protein NUU61_006140 [Penicillium alfredii]KAJ5091270.1 hypothetical protein NUU61_006140 [Penicillium alfredii]
MAIISNLPLNPIQISLENLASTGTHVFIPWSNYLIQLDAGFTSRKSQDGNPFEVPCAFANWARDSIPICYINDNGLRGSELSTVSSSHIVSSEHLSVSLGASVGWRFAGASAVGSYDKAVSDNTDVRESLELLSFRDPISKRLALHRFHETYGDYYVAGLRLGGDSCVFASINQKNRRDSEKYNVKAEARLLVLSAATTWNKDIVKEHFKVSVQFAGYDNLFNKSEVIGPGGSCLEVNQLALKYRNAGQQMTHRAVYVASEFGFRPDMSGMSVISMRPSRSASVSRGWSLR